MKIAQILGVLFQIFCLFCFMALLFGLLFHGDSLSPTNAAIYAGGIGTIAGLLTGHYAIPALQSQIAGIVDIPKSITSSVEKES
jgi:LytS/YehU family sensor histidine kinase